MRRAFIVCTVGLLLALATSAEAATQGEYYRPHDWSCGYYHYVCRAWWGRAGGKVRIQFLSRVGGCAISAFELGLD